MLLDKASIMELLQAHGLILCKLISYKSLCLRFNFNIQPDLDHITKTLDQTSVQYLLPSTLSWAVLPHQLLGGISQRSAIQRALMLQVQKGCPSSKKDNVNIATID